MDTRQIAETNSICKVRVGSHLYGTNNENSDEDFVGIFIPNFELLAAFDIDCEQVEIRTNKSSSGHKNTKEDVDYVIYNIKKFFQQAAKASPNILEILFVNQENIITETPTYAHIMVNYKHFVSKRIFDTFMGYAIQQEKLLKTKSFRYDALKRMQHYLIYGITTDTMEFLTQHQCDELNSIYPEFRNKQGAIKAFTTDTKREYVEEMVNHELDNYGYRKEYIEAYGYEVKFGSHLVRLLTEGIELGETGKIQFPLKELDLIKKIKEGKVPEKEFYEIVDHYKNKFREVEEKCTLPTTSNMKEIGKLYYEIMKKKVREELLF